jgi:predicted nucleic acid-binding protein
VARFLADSSIWGWANSGNRPDIADKLADRFERDEIVTTPPVVLEVLHRARNGREYDELFDALFAPIGVIPLGEQQSRRAMEVQRELAQITHGNHLRPAADFLVAAAAEAAGEDVVLWSFDKDLRVICAHTGQPHEAEASSRRT